MTGVTEILCIGCGEVAAPRMGKCGRCGSATVIPADSPIARRFLEARAAQRSADATSDPATSRAEATGKVLGRRLGSLFKKK